MPTEKLGIAEHAENSEAWFPSYLEIRRVADRLSCGSNEFKVDPDFSDANLGIDIASATDRRHFPTIQQAITAAEADSYGSPNTITLARAEYAERLFITKSIKIVGPERIEGAALGGGKFPKITGDGTQNEVVNIAPESGGNAAVILQDIFMENSYNALASVIDKAYLIDVVKPAAYGTLPVILTLKGVHARMQTWGDDNQWNYGIRSDGWVDILLMDGTVLVGYEHAGGNHNGGIKDLINMRGDEASGLASELWLDRASLHLDYSGAGIPALIDLNDGVVGTASSSKFWHPSAFLTRVGGTGVNQITGLGAGELEMYGNLDNIKTCRM